MFRNLRFYRFKNSWPGSEQELEEKLAAGAFRPCPAYSERSVGWEPPAAAGADSRLCRRVHGADLLCLRSQSRLLPAAAIEDALEARLHAYRARTGEEPTRREKRRLKQQTRDELLPKALLKSERTRAVVIGAAGLIGIDTLSEPRAEHFLEVLRGSVGSLDVTPLAFKRPFADLLTRIFLGDAPRGFVLGRECRMRDPSEAATVRCTDMDLGDATVRKHVKDGMQLTHLGIDFGNALSCVLDHRGGLGKLKLNGADAEDMATDEDPLARLDAEIALLGGTLQQLLAALAQALGGPE